MIPSPACFSAMMGRRPSWTSGPEERTWTEFPQNLLSLQSRNAKLSFLWFWADLLSVSVSLLDFKHIRSLYNYIYIFIALSLSFILSPLACCHAGFITGRTETSREPVVKLSSGNSEVTRTPSKARHTFGSALHKQLKVARMLECEMCFSTIFQAVCRIFTYCKTFGIPDMMKQEGFLLRLLVRNVLL